MRKTLVLKEIDDQNTEPESGGEGGSTLLHLIPFAREEHLLNRHVL